ncbi:MAG TPA: hypothetical protein VMD30_05560 [Tepidisphaeraceae bacterium]|nr:hypothetical protein [Tepidisphaeraceae bacterium]
MSHRGILYIVWGDKCEPLLQRSIDSLKKFHPDLPIHIERRPVPPDPMRGLELKTAMGQLTPFDTTLYLDADTIVMGDLSFAFAKAEEFGLACCICECPWTRRYDPAQADNIEYNTGVLFFSPASRNVMSAWQSFSRSTPSSGTIMNTLGEQVTMSYDDQASFARAVRSCKTNPFVLPLNYNLRPYYHRRFFTPIKVWHDYQPPSDEVIRLNGISAAGDRPVTLIYLKD